MVCTVAALALAIAFCKTFFTFSKTIHFKFPPFNLVYQLAGWPVNQFHLVDQLSN